MAAQAVEGAAVTALRTVFQRVRQAAERSGRVADDVRVVAVSKTKPVSLIRQVYDAGHRCFGENYVQEFIEKAPQLPQDIDWHFIGHLQSNKAKSLIGTPSPPCLCISFSLFISKNTINFRSTIKASRSSAVPSHHPPLATVVFADFICGREPFVNTFLSLMNEHKHKILFAAVPNLSMVQGVDNEKIANHLDRAVSSIGRRPLPVMVQVNTSGEISKSGIEPSHCIELVKHVKFGCPNLVFSGLMTIGMPDYTSTPENFKTLSRCRVEICRELGMPENQCELSMGMSGDFELAIEMGSTNVRIGSTIFGPRDYSKKQQQQ